MTDLIVFWISFDATNKVASRLKKRRGKGWEFSLNSCSKHSSVSLATSEISVTHRRDVARITAFAKHNVWSCKIFTSIVLRLLPLFGCSVITPIHIFLFPRQPERFCFLTANHKWGFYDTTSALSRETSKSSNLYTHHSTQRVYFFHFCLKKKQILRSWYG